MDIVVNGSDNTVEYSRSLDISGALSDNPYFIPTVTVYALTFTIGVIGNFLVMFAVLGDRKNRSMTAALMVSLAVADAIFLLICVPFKLNIEFVTNWTGGDELCKISAFVEMLSAVATIINLTAIGVERYVVIVHPMKSRFLCTKTRMSITVVIVWVVSILISLPNFFLITLDTLNFNQNATDQVVVCADAIPGNKRIYFAIYRLLVMLVAPTFVMCFSYFRVIYTLWNSTIQLRHMSRFSISNYRFRNKSSKEGKSSSPQNMEVVEARKQVIKMLLTVIVIFIVCWGPKLILNVMRTLDIKAVFQPSVYPVKMIFGYLPYVQSCLNPIIYGFMSKNFRQSLRYVYIHYIQNKLCRRPYCVCTLTESCDIEMTSVNGNATDNTYYINAVKL